MNLLRKVVAFWLPWISELVIRVVIPRKIGRYILLDVLIAFL
jgi:hypothetical protein